ncbi:hypothetical protein [Oceanihabitans sediminis]|uniref:hypothetical protein n=1 Tax=Oceanihabitans sediminis TaxID=1812012 RepID=UPI00299EA8C8|nr:hypothetical protein [Oceanihabitans sediminis]MDX1279468.1 hypothetical protein [Oceanihabitans sediminis]
MGKNKYRRRKSRRKNSKGYRGTHDKHIGKVVNRLYHSDIIDYDNIERNIEYSNNRNYSGPTGEIDVLATYLCNDKKYGVIFEVKSTDTAKAFKKAVTQLRKAKEYLLTKGGYDKIFCFYSTPKYGTRIVRKQNE